MHRVEKSVVVPHSVERMFDLVADIESYPAFLPGCTAAKVVLDSGDRVQASLQVRKGPFHHWFTTENLLVPPGRIELTLVEGPFRHLEGAWVFEASPDGGTRVSLALEFEFANRVVGKLLSPAFSEVARQMVGAFAARARELRDAELS